MPIHREDFITRDMLRRSPGSLFVFGDNIARSGLGGQAAEMRGEPNAVGIPTKRIPNNMPGAFFTDQDLNLYVSHSHSDWVRLRYQARKGGIIVLPTDGIGTGRAQLATRAPLIYADIQRRLEELVVLERKYNASSRNL